MVEATDLPRQESTKGYVGRGYGPAQGKTSKGPSVKVVCLEICSAHSRGINTKDKDIFVPMLVILGMNVSS